MTLHTSLLLVCLQNIPNQPFPELRPCTDPIERRYQKERTEKACTHTRMSILQQNTLTPTRTHQHRQRPSAQNSILLSSCAHLLHEKRADIKFAWAHQHRHRQEDKHARKHVLTHIRTDPPTHPTHKHVHTQHACTHVTRKSVAKLCRMLAGKKSHTNTQHNMHAQNITNRSVAQLCRMLEKK